MKEELKNFRKESGQTTAKVIVIKDKFNNLIAGAYLRNTQNTNKHGQGLVRSNERDNGPSHHS